MICDRYQKSHLYKSISYCSVMTNNLLYPFTLPNSILAGWSHLFILPIYLNQLCWYLLLYLSRYFLSSSSFLIFRFSFIDLINWNLVYNRTTYFSFYFTDIVFLRLKFKSFQTRFHGFFFRPNYFWRCKAICSKRLDKTKKTGTNLVSLIFKCTVQISVELILWNLKPQRLHFCTDFNVSPLKMLFYELTFIIENSRGYCIRICAENTLC